jgi:hypothetical protein
MPIQFPSNPATNQTYVYNGITWTWTGRNWTKSAADGGAATVTVSNSAPLSATTGALWVDSEYGDFNTFVGNGWITINSDADSVATTAPNIGYVVGSITSSVPSNIIVYGTNLGTVSGILTFSFGSTVTDTVIIPTTETSVEVAVPSQIYSLAAGSVGNLFWYKSNGTRSNSYAMAVSAPVLNIEYLVVAGGGGGGWSNGGGGGAGGLRTAVNFNAALSTNYTVTIGSGGAGSGSGKGANGSDSVFATITSTGGGGGGSAQTQGGVGNSGGSGGGGGNDYPRGTLLQGGAGNTPSVSPNQGNNGGANQGGGGGAGGIGADGSTNGTGGIGAISTITGASVYYAGGGGGSTESATDPVLGGLGGGGNGQKRNSTAPTSGTTNRGGGGGGGANSAGGSGGSGIVILRFPGYYSITIGAGLTATTAVSGAYKIVSFTQGTGTVSFTQ